MNLARLVPMLLVMASWAHAAEDCLFDGKLLKPQFARTLPRGFKLLSTKKDKQGLTQVLQTPEGLEVTVTVGGCAHLAFSIALTGGTLTAKTVGSELVAVARRVLPTLPMGADVTVDPKLFLRALDEANISALPAHLPCGDATCELSLEPAPVKKGAKVKKPAEGQDPPGVLKLSYDFAL